MVAALAATVGGDLFVGEHGAERRAPVDRRLVEVREPVRVDELAPASRGVERRPSRLSGSASRTGIELGDRPGPVRVLVVPGVEDLQEDPLRPAVVGDVGGRDAAPRVVAEPERPQLAAHVRDVRLGGDPRVLAGLHRVLLGREAERVVAHRVQDVVPAHPLEAGVDVGADVAERVADVEARRRSGTGTCRARRASRGRRPRRSPRASGPSGSAPRRCARPPSGPATSPRSRWRGGRRSGARERRRRCSSDGHRPAASVGRPPVAVRRPRRSRVGGRPPRVPDASRSRRARTCHACGPRRSGEAADTLEAPSGAVAQLVEHLHGMQGVMGSSPISSTSPGPSRTDRRPPRDRESGEPPDLESRPGWQSGQDHVRTRSRAESAPASSSRRSRARGHARCSTAGRSRGSARSSTSRWSSGSPTRATSGATGRSPATSASTGSSTTSSPRSPASLSISAFGWLGRLVFWPILGLPPHPARHPVRADASGPPPLAVTLLAAQQPGARSAASGSSARSRRRPSRTSASSARCSRSRTKRIPLGLALARPHRELPSRGRPVVRVGDRASRCSRCPRPRRDDAAVVLARDPPRDPGHHRRAVGASGTPPPRCSASSCSRRSRTTPIRSSAGRRWSGRRSSLHVGTAARDVRVQPLVVHEVRTATSPNGSSPRSRSPRRCRSCSRSRRGRSTSGATCGSCRCGRSRSSSRSIFFFQAFRYARELAGANGRRAAAAAPARRRDATLVIVGDRSRSRSSRPSPLLAAPRMIRRNFDGVDHGRPHGPTRSTGCGRTPRRTPGASSPSTARTRSTASERPQVANWQAIPYDRLAEWKRAHRRPRRRPEYFAGSGWHGDLAEAPGRVQPAHRPRRSTRIATKYDASCLVSETAVPVPGPAPRRAGARLRAQPRSDRLASMRGARSVDSAGVPAPSATPELIVIDVIDYRAGNAPSVMYALERLGLDAPPRRRRRTRSTTSTASILPGVGAARATHRRRSRESGLVEPLRRARPRRPRAVPRHLHRPPGAVRPQRGGRRPTASAGCPGEVRRFPDTDRVPADRLERGAVHPRAPGHRRRCPTPTYCYFVNSYYAAPDRPGRRARHHRLRRRVLLGRRPRQRDRHAVPRREERRARARAPARLRRVGRRRC